MIKWLISRLTMVKVEKEFYDFISKKDVYSYVDYYNHHWLATSRWSDRCPLDK